MSIIDLKVKLNYKTPRKKKFISTPGLGRDFLAMTPKAWYIKENTDKLGFIKIINFCSLRFSEKNEKISYRWGENMYNHICEKKKMYL